MIRVAVQVGAAWLRVAAEGRLLAQLPVAQLPVAQLPVAQLCNPGASVPSVLAGLFDAPVDELVVVRAAAGPEPGPDPSTTAVVTTPAVAGVVGTVREVPGAVAALVQHAASAGVPAASATGCAAGTGAVVVDVGHGGAEVALVRGGRVVAARRLPVGGARLDVVTAAVLARCGATVGPAEARRVREALSLLPEVRAGTSPVVLAADELRTALADPLQAVVEAVRDVVAAAARVAPGRAPPVLLVGGVARTPLLAELLDAAGVGDVQVADRPDAVAVLGALRTSGQPGPSLPGRAVPGGPGPPPPSVWLPPVVPPRHRRSRAAVAALAAVAGVLGLLAAGAVLPPASRATPPVSAVSAGDLVQYGYAVRLPAGWAHTGGLPDRRRSLLTPAAAPDGTDLISVERTPLGYDADAEPQRARAELRARFVAAVAGGAPLSAFDADARFAGRPVVSYSEAGGPRGGDVDWYVVLDGDAQLSVGCRHTPAGTGAVGAACVTVVGSLHRTL